MNFTEYLNFIYSKLNCTQTELCNFSGLSAPVISRYLSGDREPSSNSEQLKALALGIHKLALTKQLEDEELEYNILLQKFNSIISQKETLYNSFVINFNSIIDQLNINMKELSNSLNFDVSYLYRVKSGERHPVDLNNFCKLVSEYISKNRNSDEEIAIVANLLDISKEDINTQVLYKDHLLNYLMMPNHIDEDIPEMSNFLNKMDDFNLEEYIKVIHFDELKVPTLPVHLPSSKYYYGVDDMRKAEIDFLKATVLGKSKESVTMCSYMPMQELAEDMDFGKKWMFGIAMMIKKGLHLNVIHNLNRPMNELMLGFEAWIPIYMTGQVSPFHIPDYNSAVFHQINYCSGSAALMGECIDGYYNEGRYYVTNNKNEIAYFRKKTDALLKNAKPLMDIYNIENHDKFKSFIKKANTISGNRRIISSSLPDFTIPSGIIEKHLAKASEKQKSDITAYITNTNAFVDNILKENTITYDICELSKEDYEKNPITMNFPIIFSDFEFTLSYEEYLEHLNKTKEYANSHNNFKLNLVDTIPFTNIKITIVSGKYFVITKAKTPNIHFVIYHKKMLEGMENFYLSYKE